MKTKYIECTIYEINPELLKKEWKEVKTGKFAEGNLIYIKAGKTIYDGFITEVLEEGIWLTENEETEEFVSFADLETYEWKVIEPIKE